MNEAMTNDKKDSTKRSGGVYLRLGMKGRGQAPPLRTLPPVIASLAKPAEAISGAMGLPRTPRVLATTG
jgi:hypothetical protein